MKGSAPAFLDTLDEIAAAINDDENAYQTLVSLINQRQATLQVPGTPNGISLLNGTTLRDIEVSGNLATAVTDANTLAISVNGIDSTTFQTLRTQGWGLIAG